MPDTVVARLNRTELAVPASRPELFAKAARSAADVVFLDLEDAVAPSDKAKARKNAIEGLNDIDWRGVGKTVSVRINGADVIQTTSKEYAPDRKRLMAMHRAAKNIIPKGGATRVANLLCKLKA